MSVTSMIRLPATVVLGQLPPDGRRVGADLGEPQTSRLPVPLASPSVGVWECTPGRLTERNRADTETCYILCGRASITDEATGLTHDIRPGDLVVLPVGWSGSWVIDEPLRLIYVTV
jgi:uncharacterized cupin superfamily protein